MSRTLPLATRFTLLACIALLGLAVLASASPAAQPRLAALRTAPTAAVPDEVKAFVRESAPRLALDVDTTRRLAAPGGGQWDIITGPDVVCLYVEAVDASSCAKPEDAAAGKLYLLAMAPQTPDGLGGWTQPADQPATFYGVAPDGVTRASAKAHVGARASSLVNPDGLYRLETSSTVNNPTLERGAGPALLTEASAAALSRGARGRKLSPRARAAGYAGMQCIPDPSGCSGRWYDSAGSFGGWAYLSSVYARAVSGANICVNAQNTDGTWAGLAACSSVDVSHPYNKVYVRRGIVCAQGGGSTSFGLGSQGYWVP